MAADPYQVLGVNKDAPQQEIQRAYRQLAKKLHPDLNPGDKQAEEFKQISAAYDLVGDADKRAQFDRGEIDASGTERPRQRFYRDFAEDPYDYANDTGFADFAGTDDTFSRFFSREGRATTRRRGADVQYRLPLDLVETINGGRRQIVQIVLSDCPTDRRTTSASPPGTQDGQVLRLRGKGRPGINGGPAGDALIEVEVLPHPVFTLKGDDIYADLPISLRTAVLGGKVRAPTPTGPVTVTVPPWSNSGKVLRLRGKGAPRPDGGRGDEFLTLKIVLPDKPDPELERFVARWRPAEADGTHKSMEA